MVKSTRTSQSSSLLLMLINALPHMPYANCATNNHGSKRTAYLPCRSEEHTSELQSLAYLVCRLLLEKKKNRAERGCGNGERDRHVEVVALARERLVWSYIRDEVQVARRSPNAAAVALAGS